MWKKITKIDKKHFDFLNELNENNNRKWFLENKEKCFKLREEIKSFAGELFVQINNFDESLQNYWEKPYIFRVYRDARYHKIHPYKTNYWILISPWWKPKMHEKAGYFLNIKPGWKSFIIGWVWRPEKDFLLKIRKNIDKDSSKLKNILNDKNYKKYFYLEWDKL